MTSNDIQTEADLNNIWQECAALGAFNYGRDLELYVSSEIYQRIECFARLDPSDNTWRIGEYGFHINMVPGEGWRL